MNQDMTALVHGYFDGILTAREETELNEWIKADRENAAVFADTARLHDRLHDIVHASQVIEPNPSSTADMAAPFGHGRSRRLWPRVSLIGAAAALVAATLVALWWTGPTKVSAATELTRLIDASLSIQDRTYRITSLDPNPAPIEGRQAPVDGATLYIRAPDKYVLVRPFPDGRVYTTGCDGEHNWSAPPDGAVRLSRDTLRFRWVLPGHQQGIPFIDLRSDLALLRDAYVVKTLPTDAHGWRGLKAEKKSHEYRGPRQVELWYDAKTAVIHRMVFDGLPKARGGPNSVALELRDQRDLAADFFKHESHHAPGRRVIEED